MNKAEVNYEKIKKANILFFFIRNNEKLPKMLSPFLNAVSSTGIMGTDFRKVISISNIQ